jgi:K+-sensing histidine kinase KdpD
LKYETQTLFQTNNHTAFFFFFFLSFLFKIIITITMEAPEEQQQQQQQQQQQHNHIGEHIIVSVRCRPLNNKEIQNADRIAWSIDQDINAITSIPLSVEERSENDDRDRPNRIHSYAFGM